MSGGKPDFISVSELFPGAAILISPSYDPDIDIRFATPDLLVNHSETQGIYLKKGIYWLQMPMHRGNRPKPITLQTKVLQEAITRAGQIQAVPSWFHFDRRCIDMQPTPTMPFNKYKKPRVIPMRGVLFEFLQGYGLRKPFMLRPEVKQGKDIYRYDFDVALQNTSRPRKCPG